MSPDELRENVDEYYARIAEATPMRHLGTEEDVPTWSPTLCSEQTSYVTGQVIGVTGGIDLFSFDRERGPAAVALSSRRQSLGIRVAPGPLALDRGACGDHVVVSMAWARDLHPDGAVDDAGRDRGRRLAGEVERLREHQPRYGSISTPSIAVGSSPWGTASSPRSPSRGDRIPRRGQPARRGRGSERRQRVCTPVVGSSASRR